MLLLSFYVQIDRQLPAGVICADGLGGALRVLVFGPDGVVEIGSKLPEAITAVLGGDEGPDAVAPRILEINDGASQWNVTVPQNLSIESLEFCVLREGPGHQQAKKTKGWSVFYPLHSSSSSIGSSSSSS